MKDIICGVYTVKNLINNKIYIGISNDVEQRFRLHKNYLKRNIHKNKHLQNSWNKYGEDNFDFIILEKCEVLELNIKEIYYIDLYNSSNKKFGYNKTNGGNRGQHLLETIEKIRQKHIGKTHTQETKDKIRQIKIGLKASSETKDKMRESMMGKNHTQETKDKISKKNKGKKRSQEEKDKMRKSHLGKNLADGQKEKISKSLKKTTDEQDNVILILIRNGISLKKISKDLNIPYHIIIDRKRTINKQ